MERSSNKRLAVNTVILYVQLVISIVISFWTSRLVLSALGASDYGLYNVVGGLVVMLNVLGSAMVSTSYRYIAVEIGKGERGNPNKIFNTLFTVHLCLALILIILGETIGVYYVESYLNIESGRLADAHFVLQISLVTTAVTISSLPLSGLIVAREKFLFTSIVSIVSALLKLILILGLINIDGDRLRYYAILMAVVTMIKPTADFAYCLLNDKPVIKWKFNRDSKLYKEIMGFAWWILMGALACMARVQGAAIIINLFFGTLLNAAFGLATQVFEATNQFTNTLRQASVPQIIKSQSGGDEDHSINLVYKVSKYSFLLMLIPSVPIIACINGALALWLETPPLYTNIFIVLMLINGMINNLSAGFDAAIQATGNIRKNQIGYSLINLAILPIIYLLYYMGMPPYVNILAMIGLTVVTIVYQCYIMKSLTNFEIRNYIRNTIIPSLETALLAFFPALLVLYYFDISNALIIVVMILMALWTVFAIYMVGVDVEEKQVLYKFVKKWRN